MIGEYRTWVHIGVALAVCGISMMIIASDCGPGLGFPAMVSAIAQKPPKWSPDGSTIVFNSGSNIYAVATDGTHLRVIAQAKGTYDANLSPDFSPDGAKVAYTRLNVPPAWTLRAYEWEIKVADLTGLFKRTRTLAKHEAFDVNPVWSPDGTRIAFLSNRSDSRSYHLYTVGADGSNVQLVSTRIPSSLDPPVWLSDGEHIATSDGLIHRNWANGGDADNLAPGAELRMRPPVAWSPDGQQIAFLAFDEDVGKWGLYTTKAGGTDLLNVLEINPKYVERLYINTRVYGSRLGWVSWSPDGSRLLLSGGPTPITVVELNGTGSREWNTYFNFAASWAPDGARIALVRSAGVDGNTEGMITLATAKPDGSDVRVLVRATRDGLISESEHSKIDDSNS